VEIILKSWSDFMNTKYKLAAKYFSLFVIFFVALLFNFSLFRGDTFANYGFSYALSIGEIPYKDFNMVIPLFSPFLYSLGLVFNKSILFFYLEQSFFLVVLFYLLEKLLDKKVYLFFALLCIAWPISMTTVIFPGYNFICFLLLIILILCEESKQSDYIVGFILGLIFCTKQTIGVAVFIPTLIFIFRDYKRFFKRLIGYLIPICIMLLYLLFTNSIEQFIDLCFLGLFNFGNSNSAFSMFNFILLVFGCLYIIYKIWNDKKNIVNYYFLFYVVVTLPIIDYYHIALFLLGPLFLFIRNIKVPDKFYKVIYPMTFVLFLLDGMMVCLFLNNPVITNFNNFPLYVISKEYRDNIINLNNYLSSSNIDKVYLLRGSENYMFKIMNNEKIDYYDLSNHGNYGYNGEKKMVNDISKMNNKLFIVDSTLCNNNSDLYQQYICDFKTAAITNSRLVYSVGNFEVYYR
jgi:hypothetical protein